jgi:hypothetical protein
MSLLICPARPVRSMWEACQRNTCARLCSLYTSIWENCPSEPILTGSEESCNSLSDLRALQFLLLGEAPTIDGAAFGALQDDLTDACAGMDR